MTDLPSVYAGKILKIDLSTGATDSVDTALYADRFLGGRGIATKIYWDEVPPEAGALDEENRLIVSLGPMAGLPAIGGSRWGIFAKSPFPHRDHFCYGNLGGYFGAALKFAGYDGLVITGKAEEPSVLVVEDTAARRSGRKAVSVLPARDLRGMPADQTLDAAREKVVRALAASGGSSGGREVNPKKVRVMAIGPAGENLVPLATVFADGDASCGGGMGAVMGSKNLKAVAVAPLGGSRFAAGDRERLKRIEKEIRGYGRGNVKVWGLDFMASGENTTKFPCYGCMANCLRVKYTAENGKSGKFMCQSRFFYMAHAWGYYGEENDVPFYANRLCDELGIDTWEVQGVIEWLLRCHAEGMITEKESGLDLTKVGSFEFIRDLVEGMAYRRGFGELLCKGAEKASREYGRGTEKLYNRNDPYDPRYCTVNIMLLPFETREPIQQLHEAGLVLSQWSSWAKGVEEAHISSEVVRGIGRRFWGGEQAGDMTTLYGKAPAAVKIQDRQLAKESAEICDWMFPLIDNPSGSNGETRVGDPSLEARLLSAALGKEITEEEYYRYGERVFALQRAVLLREGHRPPADDVLPREYHEDPLEYHVADPDCLVPGRNGEIASQVGNVIDPKSYSRLREEYYELRGWDVPTGLPSVKGLNGLGLPEIAEELEALGLAVQRARKVPAPVILGRKAVFVVGGLIASLGRAVKSVIGADGQSRSGPAGAGTAAGLTGREGPSLRDEELQSLMEEQQVKFADPAVAHNFEGWNKTMLYYFPDIDEYYILPIKEGVGQTPEKVADPPKKPDIYYEMSTETLRAMTRGEISGFKAYQQRKLKLKASFTDMMKLQSLNKV